MATFLDIGLLNFFLPVFTFLFVLAVLYAILTKTHILGDNRRVILTASVAVAFITMFSGGATGLINFITPWFVLLGVGLLLFFGILMFLGQKEDEIWQRLGGATTILILVLIIIIVGMGQVLGPVFSPYGTSEGGKSIGGETLKTLFHPRVLGALFILLIAAFTIQQVSPVGGKKD